MTEWGQLYRDHVTALTGMASDLTNEQLSVRVPATPEWDVHDLLSHLAGGAADAVSGRLDGAPTPSWTERHVEERSARKPAELLTELTSHADDVAAAADEAETPAMVWDIAVHHADLHEALGFHQLPGRLWLPVLDAVAPRMLGDDAASVRATVPDYELFRGLFSRRSRAQMQKWGVDGLDATRLDEICVFGPRDDDQPTPEPAAT